MLKKLMTTEELFDRIKGILKEKGRLPDISDYGPGAYSPVQIKTCEFDLKSNLFYGDSGGAQRLGDVGSARTETDRRPVWNCG